MYICLAFLILSSSLFVQFLMIDSLEIAKIIRHFKIDSPHPSCMNTKGSFGDISHSRLVEKKSPIDDMLLGKVFESTPASYEKIMIDAAHAFEDWSRMPAPKRGEIVRKIGEEFRKNKEALAILITYETGKLLQESLGEVQEIIDICEFSVGLSRQLYGLSMHSERPQHRMMEQYHPLGVVGIISAFNFPAAVWAWNAMIALVCGNVCVWKPSEKTPLTAIACMYIVQTVLIDTDIPSGVLQLFQGGAAQGSWLAKDTRVALVSATGSVSMGRQVNMDVAQRFGKALLELGGNNAIIVTPEANIELAIRAIVFGAVGTAGQRCTSTRRLIVHDSILERIKNRLLEVYKQLSVGNPMDSSTLVGPLIDAAAVLQYTKAMTSSLAEGGKLCYGGKVLNGNYVVPTIIEVQGNTPTVQQETFAPILYIMSYSGSIEEAIKLQNNVPQGLSSAIFTQNIREMELFLSAKGSDCGIANVNIGTSGAEIGGAFGGEKETGGGRESGSDAWKFYMRRQTNTINYGEELPLAQGIRFDF